MHSTRIPRIIITLWLLMTGTGAAQGHLGELEAHLTQRVAQEPATVGIAIIELASGQSVAVNADGRFHAASTMKVPVLIELAQRVDRGTLRWDDTLVIQNRFASIVDGSAYQLSPSDDSDSTLYLRLGTPATYRELAHLMIARSSNLATNLLIDALDASRVEETARQLGADSIAVYRGVEDIKAFRQGLNNTTTARDLATLLAAIAEGRAASSSGTAVIISMLEAQEFKDLIPAGLPRDVRVANKTGWITGIVHDAAIIFPESCAPVIMVVLTRGYPSYAEAASFIADVARMSYDALACRR